MDGIGKEVDPSYTFQIESIDEYYDQNTDTDEIEDENETVSILISTEKVCLDENKKVDIFDQNRNSDHEFLSLENSVFSDHSQDAEDLSYRQKKAKAPKGRSSINMSWTDAVQEIEIPTKKSSFGRGYAMLRKCVGHKSMHEHSGEGVIDVGQRFDTPEDFFKHVNSHAKQWFFYYTTEGSRRTFKPTSYRVYTFRFKCVFFSGKNYTSYQAKGLRKRTKKPASQCPCRIILRKLSGDDFYTVTYVCNHHDHELSAEKFGQLQHSRRLPPEVKEEIKDLAALGLGLKHLRLYLHEVTGFVMNTKFFQYILSKKSARERTLTLERYEELKEKIECIKEKFGETVKQKRALPRRKHSSQTDHGTTMCYESDDEDMAKNKRMKTGAGINKKNLRNEHLEPMESGQESVNRIQILEDVRIFKAESQNEPECYEASNENEYIYASDADGTKEEFILDEGMAFDDDIVKVEYDMENSEINEAALLVDMPEGYQCTLPLPALLATLKSQFDNIDLICDILKNKSYSSRATQTNLSTVTEAGIQNSVGSLKKSIQCQDQVTQTDPDESNAHIFRYMDPEIPLDEQDYITKYNIEDFMQDDIFLKLLLNLATKKCIGILELLKDVYNGRAVLKIKTQMSENYKNISLSYVAMSASDYNITEKEDDIDLVKKINSKHLNFLLLAQDDIHQKDVIITELSEQIGILTEQFSTQNSKSDKEIEDQINADILNRKRDLRDLVKEKKLLIDLATEEQKEIAHLGKLNRMLAKEISKLKKSKISQVAKLKELQNEVNKQSTHKTDTLDDIQRIADNKSNKSKCFKRKKIKLNSTDRYLEESDDESRSDDSNHEKDSQSEVMNGSRRESLESNNSDSATHKSGTLNTPRWNLRPNRTPTYKLKDAKQLRKKAATDSSLISNSSPKIQLSPKDSDIDSENETPLDIPFKDPLEGTS